MISHQRVTTNSVHCQRPSLKPHAGAKNRGNRVIPRGERGAEVVEVAFTIPILVGLVFGLMVICLALYSRAYTSELAREGTRYAALHGANCVSSYSGGSCTATPAQIGTYVTSLGLPNLGGGTVSVDTASADMFPDGDQVSPHRVQVKVTYVFPYKIPFVTSTNLTMSSTSVMAIVQ
jgi:hypothetical protein